MNIFYLATTKDFVDSTSDFFSKYSFDNISNLIQDWATRFAGRIFIAIIIWIIGRKVIQIGVQIINKAIGRTGLDIGVVNFICSIARFTAYLVLVIQVINRLGFETSSFIAILGSAGLAFGLALQGSLSNFAGGVLILVFKPFRVGDYIVLGNFEGTVKVIDLLYTKLITFDNKIITIPNGTLANSSIVNVGSLDTRRLDIQIHIGYSSDLKVAKSLLEGILKEHPQVIQDQEIRVVVKSLDDSHVTLETRVWVSTESFWDTKFELLEKYKLTFDENEIEIPFNQLDVNIKNN